MKCLLLDQRRHPFDLFEDVNMGDSRSIQTPHSQIFLLQWLTLDLSLTSEHCWSSLVTYTEIAFDVNVISQFIHAPTINRGQKDT